MKKIKFGFKNSGNDINLNVINRIKINKKILIVSSISIATLLTSCEVYAPKNDGGQSVNNKATIAASSLSNSKIESKDKSSNAATNAAIKSSMANSNSKITSSLTNTVTTVSTTTSSQKNSTSNNSKSSSSNGTSSNSSNTIDTTSPEAIEVSKWKDMIYPNYKVEGINIGGLTKEEATEKIKTELLDKLAEKKILYSVDGVDQDLTFEDLEVKYDENLVEDALKYGKDLGVKEQLDLIKKGTSKDIKLKFSYNTQYVTELAGKYAIRVKNDSNSKNVVYDEDSNKVTLKKNAKEKILDTKYFEKFISDNINVEEASKEVTKIPITEVPTTIKDSDLTSIGFELSTFSTDYSWSAEGRLHNVELATDNIQNTLVMPGAEFSFNRTVGPTDKAHGFKDSKVYIGSKTVDEPGGGACQVATTLYNSVIMAGIDPTLRVNHGMTIAYVPLGLDATVYDPVLDFKFKNTYDKPILIRTKHDGSSLTFTLLGSKDMMGGYTYQFESEVTNHDPAGAKTVEDPTLPQGYEKVETTPYDGYKVKVYKITLKDGVQVKRELYTEDEYKRVDEITRIGTGSPDIVVTTTEN